MYNNAGSVKAVASEKVHPLLSSHIKIHQHICSELFLHENSVFHCAYFCPDSEKFTFSLKKKAIFHIEDLRFSQMLQFDGFVYKYKYTAFCITRSKLMELCG